MFWPPTLIHYTSTYTIYCFPLLRVLLFKILFFFSPSLLLRFVSLCPFSLFLALCKPRFDFFPCLFLVFLFLSFCRFSVAVRISAAHPRPRPRPADPRIAHEAFRRGRRRHGHSFRRGPSFRGAYSTRRGVRLRRGHSYLLFHLRHRISNRAFQPLYYQDDQHFV